MTERVGELGERFEFEIFEEKMGRVEQVRVLRVACLWCALMAERGWGAGGLEMRQVKVLRVARPWCAPGYWLVACPFQKHTEKKGRNLVEGRKKNA